MLPVVGLVALKMHAAGHFVKSWKVRWFVLQNDKLFYFKSRNDSKPKGCVVLKGTYVAPTKKVNRDFCFEVSDSRSSKVFFIHAASKAEMDSWVEAIEKASKHNPVSEPITVHHKIHVNYDTETGFSGLPGEWEELLKINGISAAAYSSPQEAEREVKVAVLSFSLSAPARSSLSADAAGVF